MAFCSCSKKNLFDPESWNYYAEPFFDLFYSMDGEEQNYNLVPGKKASDTFTIPRFGFYDDSEGVVAQLSFEWKDKVRLCLNSTHQYFVNNHTYPLSKSCTFEVNGWTAVSGSYSLFRDMQYVQPNGADSYITFTVRFDVTAMNSDGITKKINNGQLIFKRNVTEKMSAGDFAYYIYDYLE